MCERCGHQLNLLDPSAKRWKRENERRLKEQESRKQREQTRRLKKQEALWQRDRDEIRLRGEIQSIQGQIRPVAVQPPLGLQTLIVCPNCQGHMVPQCTNAGRQCPLCAFNIDKYLLDALREIQDREDAIARLHGKPPAHAVERANRGIKRLLEFIIGFAILYFVFRLLYL